MRNFATARFGLAATVAGLVTAFMVAPATAAVGATAAPLSPAAPHSAAAAHSEAAAHSAAARRSAASVSVPAATRAATAAPTLSPAGAPAMPPNPGSLRLRDAARQRLSSGVVTGSVRGLRGVPLSGACVTARGPSGTRSVRTAADGRFVISGLRTGPYTLEYRDCAAPGRYFEQWSGGSDLSRAASPLHIAGGQLKTLTPVTLRPTSLAALFKASTPAWLGGIVVRTDTLAASARHGRISGRVTDRAGHPLRGICVYAIRGSSAVMTHTGKRGAYLSGPLKPGKYLVAFVPGCGNNGNWLLQFYKDTGDPAKAKPVTVTAGKTTANIDARLRPGGVIKGMVTSKSGAKLSGICVGLVQQTSDGVSISVIATRHGAYAFNGLPSGRYAVQFQSGCPNPGNYAPQQWKDKPLGLNPTLIRITPPKIVSNIDAVLAPGAEISGTVTYQTTGKPLAGVISGTVTGTGGKPLSDVCVTATSLRNGSSAQADNYVTERGRYTISGLAAGAYRVEFSACGPGNYANVWYRNKSTQSAATRVIVRAGRTTPGINAAMTRGGSISGHVSAVGHPVANACVFVYDPVTFAVYGVGNTNHLGNYVVPDLNTGSDQVEFAPCNAGGPNLAAQIRPGLVHVIAGKAVTGVNAALVRGGSVSGAVSGGTPATAQGGICVDIVPTVPGQAGSAGVTGTGGRYLASNLAPGKYQVFFGDPVCPYGPYSLAPQWYQDQPTRATATKVTVTAGQTTPAVDATLANDGQVSGTVTGPAHAALTGICVAAVQPGAVTVIAATRGGSYSIIDLTPGRYRVEFTSGCGASGYANQWWKDAGSAAKATVITVRASTVTTGIDAVLKH